MLNRSGAIGFRVAAALMLLASYSVAYAGFQERLGGLQSEIESQQAELGRLDSELEHARKNIQNLSGRERRLISDQREIEVRIGEKQEKLEDLSEGMLLVETDIASLEERLLTDMKEGQFYADLLRESLRRYYIRKKSESALPWFAGHLMSPPEFHAEKQLIYIPAGRYNEITQEIKRTSVLKKQHQEKMERLALIRREVIKVQNGFIEKRKKQLVLLKGIKSDREKIEVSLRGLEEKRDKLADLLGSLREKATNLERLRDLADDFVSARGQLPWPVEGDVISRFGRQRHQALDAFVYNRGVTIRPSGAGHVMAVGAGEVVFSGEFDGMGIIVVIDHGKDYYTIYGNLEYAEVSSGGEIEMLGGIGKASGIGLYFELGRGAQPEDPLKWLSH